MKIKHSGGMSTDNTQYWCFLIHLVGAYLERKQVPMKKKNEECKQTEETIIYSISEIEAESILIDFFIVNISCTSFVIAGHKIDGTYNTFAEYIAINSLC